jgi:hypothetical protein
VTRFGYTVGIWAGFTRTATLVEMYVFQYISNTTTLKCSRYQQSLLPFHHPLLEWVVWSLIPAT